MINTGVRKISFIFSKFCANFEKVQILFIHYFRIPLSRDLKGYNNLKTISYVLLKLCYHLVNYCIADSFAEGLRNMILLNPFNTFAIVIIHPILWMGKQRFGEVVEVVI